jgi:hypothetical protein
VKPSNDEVITISTKLDSADNINNMKPETKTVEHFSTKYAGIQNLISVSTSPSTKIKKKHLESMNVSNDQDSSSSNQKSFSSNIETSIRQKSDLEKWRNKQRQREREYELDSRQNSASDQSNKSKRITPMTRDELKKMNDSQIFKISPVQRPQSSLRNESNRKQLDLYSSPSYNAQNNAISSENNKHHSPIRVQIAHKPTVADTSRVYNPYPIKNEYDKFTKNGFVFEPILNNNNKNNNNSYTEPIGLSKSEARRLSTSLITKPNIKNANIAFSSESISPYTRKENKNAYKNTYDNEPPLVNPRGNVNNKNNNNNTHQFKKETEFQNLNNLKTFNETKRISDQSEGNSIENNQSNRINSSSKAYEDEYDIANKLAKKPDQNMRLLSSINNELKKFQTGYQQHDMPNS